MMRVGITGGIGCGKTLVCKILQVMGVPVFFSDDETKQMYNDDNDIRSKLTEVFGRAIYNDSGHLQTTLLAQKVFENSDALAQLNAIAHPALALRFQRWCALQTVPLAAQEAALIFESGADKYLDKIVAVCAPEEVRIARVMQRDKCSETSVRQRMRYQLSEEERSARADYTITNDGKEAVLPQILQVMKELRCERKDDINKS